MGVTLTEKRCPQCAQTRALDGFAIDRSKPSGRKSWCRECSSAAHSRWLSGNRERMAEYNRKYNDATRERVRERHLQSTYGITASEYEAMNDAQGGVCALCGLPEQRKPIGKAPSRLCVDHCHATGRVRGLLCHRCNSMLGMSGDSAAVLQRAIEYLKQGDTP